LLPPLSVQCQTARRNPAEVYPPGLKPALPRASLVRSLPASLLGRRKQLSRTGGRANP